MGLVYLFHVVEKWKIYLKFSLLMWLCTLFEQNFTFPYTSLTFMLEKFVIKFFYPKIFSLLTVIALNKISLFLQIFLSHCCWELTITKKTHLMSKFSLWRWFHSRFIKLNSKVYQVSMYGQFQNTRRESINLPRWIESFNIKDN